MYLPGHFSTTDILDRYIVYTQMKDENMILLQVATEYPGLLHAACNNLSPALVLQTLR